MKGEREEMDVLVLPLFENPCLYVRMVQPLEDGESPEPADDLVTIWPLP
jgi:hypothetical protein